MSTQNMKFKCLRSVETGLPLVLPLERRPDPARSAQIRRAAKKSAAGLIKALAEPLPWLEKGLHQDATPLRRRVLFLT